MKYLVLATLLLLTACLGSSGDRWKQCPGDNVRIVVFYETLREIQEAYDASPGARDITVGAYTKWRGGCVCEIHVSKQHSMWRTTELHERRHCAEGLFHG